MLSTSITKHRANALHCFAELNTMIDLSLVRARVVWQAIMCWLFKVIVRDAMRTSLLPFFTCQTCTHTIYAHIVCDFQYKQMSMLARSKIYLKNCTVGFYVYSNCTDRIKYKEYNLLWIEFGESERKKIERLATVWQCNKQLLIAKTEVFWLKKTGKRKERERKRKNGTISVGSSFFI